MNPVFFILAVVTLAGALGAVALRNMVHCALCLAVTFIGIAALFLHQGAQFAGLVQVLVYVGAVAVLIVFAILLTRSGDARKGVAVFSRSWKTGLLTAAATLATLVAAIVNSPGLLREAPRAPELSVRQIGLDLMSQWLLPLEILGLLLTATMIGAVILAMPEKPSGEPAPGPEKGARP